MSSMAWSDSTPYNPTRSRYVPHFRSNNNGVVSSYNNHQQPPFPLPNDNSTYYPANRFGGPSTRPPRGRGRGRGRDGFVTPRRFSPRHEEPPYRSPFEPNDETENAVVVNFDAYESVPVEVSGDNVPPPVNVFAETELDEELKKNIERCKYVKPTPVQRYAIPIAVAGRDLMACAQTGSGKTAAFCFPIISGILKARSCTTVPPRGGSNAAYPTALILSPTRELSCQIHAEASKFAYQTGVKIVVAYGGASIGQQLRNLEKGVDILVATPGRLVDMIERERVSLKKIQFLALDEADRMLDMGFEHQIRNIVEQCQMPKPGVRQTMLFSATFPDDIQRLASDFLSNYVFLTVGKVGSSTELIVQKIELVQDTEKRNLLMDLLRRNGANGKPALTLVFVETKKGADALENWLSRNGFPAIAIHGDKVQMERERALRSFKRGFTPILVATDVASRGLDIPHVAHVINFDFPRDIDDYVHRIGRTGRAGKSGLATAFFSSKNIPVAKGLVELLKEANQEVPSWLSQYAEGPNTGGRSNASQRNWRGNYSDHNYNTHRGYGGRDIRNAAAPEVENYHYNNTGPGVESYHHNSTYSNVQHSVDSYTNTSFDIKNSNYDSSFDAANTAFAGSYSYTNAADLCGEMVGKDGPCGFASVVPTGWD